MEAVGAGASIIAVTTVALQSSRVIYETISGIKNGPEEVKELASEVQQLCHLLRQVTEISKKIDDRDVTSASELQSVIEQCRQNLDDFQKQFDKLEVSSNERRLIRAWKRVKLVVKKEDFQKMWRTVSHYVNILGRHLDLIGREMDDHHKVELARSTHQTSAASELLRQNNGMLLKIGNSLSAVGRCLARQETERDKETIMIKSSHQAVDCLGVRLNDLASMSKGQNEILLEKFEQLQSQFQSQIEELKTLHGQAPTKYSSTESKLGQEQENSNLADEYDIIELSASIKRLSSLASKPRSTVFSHEAQCIISDVEKILIFISETPKDTEANESRKRKHDQTANEEFVGASRKSQLQIDVGKMRGLLTSSEHVSVGQRALSGVDFSLEDRRHRQTMNQNYATELGRVSVLVKRRRLFKNSEPRIDVLTDEIDQQVENVFEGTVSLIPERDVSRTKISASFVQKWTKNGHFSLKPSLSFCAVIPDNSHIFSLTSKGDLKGIINHIQHGHASLTDCDSKGRTLLNYALNCQKFEVSKFLITAGADVDALEPPLWDYDGLISHVGRISKFASDYDINETQLDSVWKLGRLLLEAGADPTNHHSTSDRPYHDLLSLVLVSNNFDSLKKLFDISAEFIDLKTCLDDHGRTALLLCTGEFGYGANLRCVEFLLDRGADVTTKDDDGNTCLHNVLQSSHLSGHDNRDELKNLLVLLIQAGADVYATTNDGESVSDMAYTFILDFFEPICLGHVWEEALLTCGYDATWFREDFCRRKHAVVGDECPCRKLGGRYTCGETSPTDITDEDCNIEKRCSKWDEPITESKDQDSESDEQNSERDKQNSKNDELDHEYSEDGVPNSQTNHLLNHEDFGSDEQRSPDAEQPDDTVMQDSGHSTLPYDPTILFNIWNQPDCGEPWEESVERSGNISLPQNHLPWAEDLPDAESGWGWDQGSNPRPQVSSSISPWIQNNTAVFEVEDGGAESWDTL